MIDKPENNCIKISCSEISSVDLKNIGRTFSRAIEKAADDPAFREKYEQSKKMQKQR